jgi:hypothetical protein
MNIQARDIKNILFEFYQHGVNAYVVKPVNFSDFMAAVKQLGIFWAGVNEPPPQNQEVGAPAQRGEGVLLAKEEK